MVHIGTSGWHYPHWRGVFYPPTLAPTHYLGYYARHFGTVEINNSFYQLPGEAAFRQWREAVPGGFVFAVKASSYITHRKKLRDPARTTPAFLARVRLLGNKLGPVLFQLPPRWRADPERLASFLSALPADLACAFELRDPSWFNPRVEEILRSHRAAFCIYEFDWRLSPLSVTADFVYIRLHGPEGAYRGRYGRRRLRPWAERITGWRQQDLTVYCYFDNDEAGYAVRDALELKDLLG